VNTIIQWPPSLTDVLTAGGFIGAAILNAWHSKLARQRMFQRIEDLENEHAQLKVEVGTLRNELSAYRDVLIRRQIIKPTNPGFVVEDT
jgi:hypothetical protein